MKQFACAVLFLLFSLAGHTQTAAQQQSTNPTPANDKAISTPAAPATAPTPANPKLDESVAKVGSTAPVEEPAVPTMKKFPANDPEQVDPTVAVPPLKSKKVTLIGGIVREIDPIRNRMTVDIYGGKSMKLVFDDRTKVSRNGAESNYFSIRKGDRVYLDTQIYQQKIFAKQIQIVTKTEAADVSGQVVNFDPKTRQLDLRDSLSGRPFTFTVDQGAAITSNGGKAGTLADLQPGALVTAHFNPGQGGRGSIRDLNVLAEPGAEFKLYGQVNHLDLRAGRLAVQNKADDKAYEVKFDPAQFGFDDLHIGSEVSVTAKFDGQDYVAQSLNVTSAPAADVSSRVDSDQATDANDRGKEDNKQKKHESKDKEGNAQNPENPK